MRLWIIVFCLFQVLFQCYPLYHAAHIRQLKHKPLQHSYLQYLTSIMNCFRNTLQNRRFIKRLTKIFGRTPGPRLALAQGEAALSAQETPHPCPACGRARSSQPPFAPSLGDEAAKECPRTPLCCPSPEITLSKSFSPSTQLDFT